MNERNYALRFISGKYQGGEFPLPESGEIVIGRSSDLDMVLVEDMVSRRHSKITVSPTELHIEDLGSTNGTFVNGEKITRAKIGEGDRVLVGTSIIKVVTVQASQANVDIPSGTAGRATAEMDHSNTNALPSRPASQVRTMTGSVAEIPLPDLIQLFSTSRKTGVLSVRTATDTGRIFIEEGNLISAQVQSSPTVPPEKAFVRILSWPEGDFEMDSSAPLDCEQRMEVSTEGLLMDAMRQLDELRQLESQLPPLESAIRCAPQMEQPWNGLSAEQLQLLQTINACGTVGRTLDELQGSDLQSGQALAELLRLGIAVVDS